MKIVKFCVNNWAKYNPRTDRKNYSWFRFENTFFIDPHLYSLSVESKMFLIYLFCEASKRGDGTGTLNVSMVTAMVGISEDIIFKAIQDIEIAGIATFDNQAQPEDTIGCPTNDTIRTNDTNERYDTNEHDHTLAAVTESIFLDFESAYLSYPKKMGKSKGIQSAKSKIKSQKKYDLFLKAIKNYSHMVEGTEAQYIKQFSTFVNCWEDFVDIDPELTIKKPCQKSIFAVLSSGITDLRSLQGNEDLKLSQEDLAFIASNGGLLNLGKMNEYNFNMLFK